MTTVGIATGAGRGMGLACARRMAGLVDTLLLVDRDGASATAAAKNLSASSSGTAAEPFVVDITDRDGLARLADRVRELGTLRAVAHAAGISPSMADWRRILTVDLTGTALVAEALRPLATAGTAMVCFASMAPLLGNLEPAPAVAAILDDPLDERFPDRLRDALGRDVENPGVAYAWAKHGVQRFVRAEAVRLGPAGARICSVSPGIIDTPQGRQEAASHPTMDKLVRQTPLGRAGQPDEVAAVVAFLLSEQASFVNGIDILIDGGVYAALRQLSSPECCGVRAAARSMKPRSGESQSRTFGIKEERGTGDERVTSSGVPGRGWVRRRPAGRHPGDWRGVRVPPRSGGNGRGAAHLA
jgi:NAD(P)-dependent dehydrogenase (short-subunit alcohol dehydrogenase family)